MGKRGVPGAMDTRILPVLALRNLTANARANELPGTQCLAGTALGDAEG